MSAFFRFLQAPYPIEASYHIVLRRSIVISAFVALFLLIFQPFGLAGLEGYYKWIYILSYGIPTFIGVVVIGFLAVWLCRKYDLEKVWTVKYEILLTLLFPVVIGAANALHSCFIFHWKFSFQGFLRLEAYTIAVSFFPIVGIIAADWVKLMKTHEKAASFLTALHMNEDTVLSKKSSLVVLTGENQNEEAQLSINDVVYIKAEGNYVDIILRHENDETVESITLRSSLRSIEEQLTAFEHSIVRCHRSYLVNENQIHNAVGNAQGLTLSFKFIESVIPVSRKYVDSFR